MIGLLVELTFSPGKAEEAASALETLVSVAREREGTLAYDVYRHPADREKFQLVELYRDEGAKQAHIADERIQRQLGFLQTLVSEPPKLQPLEHVMGWSHR